MAPSASKYRCFNIYTYLYFDPLFRLEVAYSLWSKNAAFSELLSVDPRSGQVAVHSNNLRKFSQDQKGRRQMEFSHIYMLTWINNKNKTYFKIVYILILIYYLWNLYPIFPPSWMSSAAAPKERSNNHFTGRTPISIWCGVRAVENVCSFRYKCCIL